MAPTAQRIIPLRAYWEIERAEGGNRTTAWILTQHLYKKRKEKTIGQTQSYEGGHMESRKQRTSPTHQNNAIFLSPSRAPNTVQRSTHVSTVKTIIESSFIYTYVRTYVCIFSGSDHHVSRRSKFRWNMTGLNLCIWFIGSHGNKPLLFMGLSHL